LQLLWSWLLRTSLLINSVKHRLHGFHGKTLYKSALFSVVRETCVLKWFIAAIPNDPKLKTKKIAKKNLAIFLRQ
jgi:hypothetical protein